MPLQRLTGAPLRVSSKSRSTESSDQAAHSRWLLERSTLRRPNVRMPRCVSTLSPFHTPVSCDFCCTMSIRQALRTHSTQTATHSSSDRAVRRLIIEQRRVMPLVVGDPAAPFGTLDALPLVSN
jgi:hypothetical protein